MSTVTLNFNKRSITINTAGYNLWDHDSNGIPYIQYDNDQIYISGTAPNQKVWVMLIAWSGELQTILAPTPAPTEGVTIDFLGHLIYHAGNWYLQIG